MKSAKMKISIREMIESDFELITNYFLNLNPEIHNQLGIDINKLPNKTQWIEKLQLEYKKPNVQKDFYYIIWCLDGEPIGHSNINDIVYGRSAVMHLHIWRSGRRRSGLGLEYLKKTIPFYFNNFKLKKLICQPNSQNIAPNRTLKKVGFEFIKKYETVPGWLNFNQTVNRYELKIEQYEKLKQKSN